MQRFLKNIGLFALPFVGLLLYLYAAPQEKAYAYNSIQKDCRAGKWIYDRLFESAQPVDIAFMGTSKTMCDVNDRQLEGALRDAGVQAHIANFGVCRSGENLHYLIARDVLEQKKPRYLIMEVSTHLATNSHFHFPHVAQTRDVFGAPLWLNVDYPNDIVNFTWNRLVYQRERVLGIDRSYAQVLDDPVHSFMVVPDDVIADSTEMERIKTGRQLAVTTEAPGGLQGIFYGGETNYPLSYYRGIAELCQQHGTQLIFLYLPFYGAGADRPRRMADFEAMAPVWLAPQHIFGDPKLHFDHSHLNQKGAALYTAWLQPKVAALLSGDAGVE